MNEESSPIHALHVFKSYVFVDVSDGESLSEQLSQVHCKGRIGLHPAIWWLLNQSLYIVFFQLCYLTYRKILNL